VVDQAEDVMLQLLQEVEELEDLEHLFQVEQN
jgi:hypothetical protein